MKTTIRTLTAILALSSPALAASSADSEGNGLLVTLFLGFGALIIVFQLLPGLILFGSMLKGLFTKQAKETPAMGSNSTDRTV